MTPLVRRYVKTSFLFLVAGLLLGASIVIGEFVMGVSPPRLHVTAHALRASAEFIAGFTPAPTLRLLIAAGGAGQLAGTVLFVVNMWSRVRMPSIHPPAGG